MFTSFIIAFREGLEAALIVGIILSYTEKFKQKYLNRYIYLAAAIGILLSLIFGEITFSSARKLNTYNENIFTGIMMIVSAVLIVYFITWSVHVRQNLNNKLSKNIDLWGIFILTLVSVFREGLEIVVITLTKITANANLIATGTILGVIAAVIIAYIIFKTSIKLNIGLIFKILGVVLAFIGGEMFAEGIMKLLNTENEFIETGLLIIYIVPLLFYFLRDNYKRA